MKHALKIFAIFLMAAMMALPVLPAGAQNTEPIIIYADQETALVNPLLMLRELEGIDELMAQWGERQLFVQSPEEMMTVFASLRKDGALAILAINGDPENAFTTEIHIQGFRASGPVVPYVMEAGQLFQQEITIPLVDDKFGYEFAPNSLTLFIIPGASFPLIPLAAVSVVAAGVAAGVLMSRRRRGKKKPKFRAKRL